MTDKNDAGEHGKNQNANDGGGQNQNADIEARFQAMEERISRQIAGAVRRMIPKDGQLADGSALVEIAGEKYTVAELADQIKTMKVKEAEMTRREKMASIERSLAAHKVLPEFIPMAAKFLADTADLSNSKVFDDFCSQHPNMIASGILPGTGGGTGAGGGGGSQSSGKVDLTNEKAREAYFNNVAKGKVI